MDLTEYHAPTAQEIDAQIRAAHAARAVALRGWARSAARWLTHSRLKARTA